MSDLTTAIPASCRGAAPRPGLSRRPVTMTMAARCARLASREIDAFVMSLFLPVMLMVTFVYLFGGAISTGTRYITYVVPGVLLLCAGVGSATTAVTVCRDMTGGIIDRFRAMDVGSLPVLAGHVAASVAHNAASSVLVFAVALGIGFRPRGPAAWAAVAGLLLLYVLALSWLAAATGLLVSSPSGQHVHVRADDRHLREQRLRPGAHDAGVAARFRQPPAGHAGHRNLRGLLLGTPIGARARQAVACAAGPSSRRSRSAPRVPPPYPLSPARPIRPIRPVPPGEPIRPTRRAPPVEAQTVMPRAALPPGASCRRQCSGGLGFLLEHRDQLGAEGRQVVRVPARDEHVRAAVAHLHLGVDPVPPALRMSVCRLGHEVSVRPRTTSASTSVHGPWQMTATGFRPGRPP